MDRHHALKAIVGFAICPLWARNGLAEEGAHWSYAGATGPDHWGKLDPANRVCPNRHSAIADRH
jgi:carbonic anhydrase